VVEVVGEVVAVVEVEVEVEMVVEVVGEVVAVVEVEVEMVVEMVVEVVMEVVGDVVAVVEVKVEMVAEGALQMSSRRLLGGQHSQVGRNIVLWLTQPSWSQPSWSLAGTNSCSTQHVILTCHKQKLNTDEVSAKSKEVQELSNPKQFTRHNQVH
jgi:hypothetical protein